MRATEAGDNRPGANSPCIRQGRGGRRKSGCGAESARKKCTVDLKHISKQESATDEKLEEESREEDQEEMSGGWRKYVRSTPGM